MKFLFVTLQHVESDFYGRVGSSLVEHGHEIAHVTFSRRAALRLRRQGFEAYCLPDVMADLPESIDDDAHAARVVDEYDTPSLRDVYRTDLACRGRSEAFSVARTIRHFLAMERVFDKVAPDVVFPEVGNETIRTTAHLIGMARSLPVVLVGYTIFPSPLRLAVDSLAQPLVAEESVRPLSEEEDAEVHAFISEFTRRAEPIRAYREQAFTARRARMLARHILVGALFDRDNDYLQPLQWTVGRIRERIRTQVARELYQPLHPSRPFVYFPLHVADDYKLTRLVPHRMDQVSIAEQVARSLPHGFDLVIKEHPMAIGRDPVAMLRRLDGIDNVRLVSPLTSSHDLIEASQAVVVISSTVGLEALLYGKSVMTLGEPYYSGYGVTLDLSSTASLREELPALPGFRPNPERIRQVLHAFMRECQPGAPVLVDRSQANAEALARSLHTFLTDTSRGGNHRSPPHSAAASSSPVVR